MPAKKTHKKRNVYNPSSGLAGCRFCCLPQHIYWRLYTTNAILESPSNCANKHPCVYNKKNTGRRYFNGSVPLCTFLCMRFFFATFFFGTVIFLIITFAPLDRGHRYLSERDFSRRHFRRHSADKWWWAQSPRLAGELTQLLHVILELVGALQLVFLSLPDGHGCVVVVGLVVVVVCKGERRALSKRHTD